MKNLYFYRVHNFVQRFVCSTVKDIYKRKWIRQNSSSYFNEEDYEKINTALLFEHSILLNQLNYLLLI